MGNGDSRPEQELYKRATENNVAGVRELARRGVSTEWLDANGRTALIVTCSYAETYDTALELLKLGANVHACSPGKNSGQPLHYAARKGLEKTVNLLLQYGADPLGVNTEKETPIVVARQRGYTTVVRILEAKIALFQGFMQEQTLTGPKILEAMVAGWIFKKCFVVVLPIARGLLPGPQQHLELVIYSNERSTVPRVALWLQNAECSLEKPTSDSPAVVIVDRQSGSKYKLLADKEAKTPNPFAAIQLYNACRGMTQGPAMGAPRPPAVSGAPVPDIPMPVKPGKSPQALQEERQEEAALRMAIDASIRTAAAEGVPVSPGRPGPARPGSSSSTFNGWAASPPAAASYNGWGPEGSVGGGGSGSRPRPSATAPPAGARPHAGGAAAPIPSSVTSWVASEGPAFSRPGGRAGGVVASGPVSAPSAPPLPPDAPIRYPTIVPPLVTPSAPPSAGYGGAAEESHADGSNKGSGGTCSVCLDAPAQAICVPCGHVAGCMECMTEIHSKGWGCPVCRAPIREVIKVFLPSS